MVGKPRIDVEEWLARVQAAEEYRADQLKATQKLVDMYRAQVKKDFIDVGGEAVPTINKVWEYMSSVLPQVFYENPTAHMRPAKEGQGGNAEVAEAVLNDAIRRIKFSKHGRRVVTDTEVRGWGVSKVGYIPPGLTVSVTPSGRLKEEKEPQQTTPIDQFNPDSDNMNGQVTVQAIPVENLIIDPDAVDGEDAAWMCHVSLERYGEALLNKHYSNVDQLELADLEESKAVSKRYGSGKPPRSESFVKIYEIWIRDFVDVDEMDRPKRHRRKLLVLAEGVDKPLRWEDWPFSKMKDYPFDLMVFAQDPKGEMPGLSSVGPWAGLAEGLNGWMHRSNRFVKDSGSKYVYDKDIKSEVMDQFSRGVDNILIPMETKPSIGGKDYPLDKRVVPVQLATLPSEFWALGQQLETQLHQVSGHIPFGDAQAKSAGTATESNILAKTASLRTEDRLKNGVAEWAQSVFTKMWHVISEFYLYPDEVEVLTPGQQKKFQQFVHSDLDFEAVINVDFGTIGRIVSDEQKKRERTILTHLIMPFLLAPHGITPAAREWMRQLLKSYHYTEIEALLPDQILQNDPRAENSMLFAGRKIRVWPADQDELHIPIHMINAQAAQEAGYGEDILKAFQEHIQEHVQSQQNKASQGEGGNVSPQGSIAGNPDADGMPGPTPTSPDQTAGVNMPGGM